MQDNPRNWYSHMSCPCERTISSQYLLYNKRQTWILDTVEFMDVTDGRYRWRCVVLWEKEKQYREPMCCWTGISVRKLLFSAKFLNVDHAWMYANEVDAVKLESRGLFTVGVNLNGCFSTQDASCRNCCTWTRNQILSIFSLDVKCFALK